LHVTLTRVSTGDQPIETATIVAEEMHRWLRDLEGFEGFLMLSREGTTLGLTFWESAEAAERHRVPRAQFRERMTSVADVKIEEVVDYQVMFAHLGPLQI
jgi:heme-degrading monooxygenase HmoA